MNEVLRIGKSIGSVRENLTENFLVLDWILGQEDCVYRLNLGQLFKTYSIVDQARHQLRT